MTIGTVNVTGAAEDCSFGVSGVSGQGSERPAVRSACPSGQASPTAATSFCSVSLASPNNIVVLGS